MKYEEIEVGESYEYNIGHELKVISKNDDHKAAMTIDEDEEICGWDENELELFKPIKKELPESWLLVNNFGGIIYKTSGDSGFGFNSQGRYYTSWSDALNNVNSNWKTATPEEEAKFIKLLKQEAEKRGLGVDAKIKGHAHGDNTMINKNFYTPRFALTEAWNKNGQIFHNGTWAQPITMLDEVTDVIKKHLPNIVVEMTDGVVTLKQL